MRRKTLLVTLLLAFAFAPPTAGAQSPRTPQRDSWFGSDKIKHFLMSAFIQSLTFSGLQYAGAHRNAAFAGSIGVTAAFGIGKEFHDKRIGEPFSLRDIAWDAAGAGSAIVMLRHTQR
jgi:putative lipoprotein